MIKTIKNKTQWMIVLAVARHPEYSRNPGSFQIAGRLDGS